MRTLFKDLNPKGAGERFLAGLYLAIRTDRSSLAGLFLRRPFPRQRCASRLCLDCRQRHEFWSGSEEFGESVLGRLQLLCVNRDIKRTCVQIAVSRQLVPGGFKDHFQIAADITLVIGDE